MRFSDNIFSVWSHSMDELDIFFDMNKTDPAKKFNLLWKLLLTH